MQRSALCRSRRELSNEYLLAKFGFDTAENEPVTLKSSGNWEFGTSKFPLPFPRDLAFELRGQWTNEWNARKCVHDLIHQLGPLRDGREDAEGSDPEEDLGSDVE